MATPRPERQPPPPPVLVGALMGVAWLPLYFHLPWWTVCAAAAFTVWRYAQGRYVPAPARPMRWILVMAVALLIYARFHTFVGEHPGLAFLVMLMGLKCLEARSARDAVVLVLLSYVALLGDLLFKPSLSMGLLALGFVTASFVALSQIAQPRGLSLRQRIGQSVILTLQALPLAFAAYVVFPRVAGGLWHRDPRPIGQTGLTPELRPGSLSALLSSRAVAMRVIFHGRRPARDRRYFRAYVLTKTNGRVWQRGPMGAIGLTRGPRRATYTVLLNPAGTRVLPALDWPMAAPPRTTLVAGGLLRSHTVPAGVTRYRLTAGAERAARLGARERRVDLALPTTLDPRIRALARRLAGGAATGGAIAARVLDYFRGHGFVYTLNPPPMGRHPVTRFLFQVRAGYCEDYAAAFAVLMRAAGVPTRVVVGFLGGEYNPDGGDVIIRNYDAHSWDEIWVRGRWRRVDPTAAVAPGALRERLATWRLMAEGHGRLVGRPWWRALSHRLQLWHDAVTTGWDNWVVDYSRQRQRALLTRLGGEAAQPAALALLALVAGIAIAAAIRAYGRRSQTARDAARDAYDRYCRKLGRIGLGRDPAEGPQTYCRRAGQQRPDLKTTMEAITASYIAARYAHEPQAAVRLKRQVARFRPRGRA